MSNVQKRTRLTDGEDHSHTFDDAADADGGRTSKDESQSVGKHDHPWVRVSETNGRTRIAIGVAEGHSHAVIDPAADMFEKTVRVIKRTPVQDARAVELVKMLFEKRTYMPGDHARWLTELDDLGSDVAEVAKARGPSAARHLVNCRAYQIAKRDNIPFMSAFTQVRTGPEGEAMKVAKSTHRPGAVYQDLLDEKTHDYADRHGVDEHTALGAVMKTEEGRSLYQQAQQARQSATVDQDRLRQKRLIEELWSERKLDFSSNDGREVYTLTCAPEGMDLALAARARVEELALKRSMEIYGYENSSSSSAIAKRYPALAEIASWYSRQ